MTGHAAKSYRGRLAPSPSGALHVGHLRTFDIARKRAFEHGGVLVLRNDDLDRGRCRPEFAEAIYEDLRKFGFSWQEGPDIGGNCGPYSQSERTGLYRRAWRTLLSQGCLYPCRCSRKDVRRNLSAPHEGEEEPVYPGTCRPQKRRVFDESEAIPNVSWRFRVPDNETVVFNDANLGPQSFHAASDLGDFVVWRRDGLPSYHLAAVVDDAAMGITEAVRGADLLSSSARQILLYRALELEPPVFYHCSLVRDAKGKRLAKRHDSLSLRTLLGRGRSPGEILRMAESMAG